MKPPEFCLVFLSGLLAVLPSPGVMCRAAIPNANAVGESAFFISPDDPSTVQKAITSAVRDGRNELVIPPGIYRIPPLPTGSGPDAWHLLVENAKNLNIRATGVTLVFTDRTRASLIFKHCDNVTFEGATLTRETPAFSQGRIEAVSSANSTVDVRVAKGYPTDIDNKALFPHVWMHVFSPTTRRWKTEARGGTPPVLEKLEPDFFRVRNVSLKNSGALVEVGDLVAWRGEVFTDIRIYECSNMRFTGVAVKGGAGFGFQEMGGDGGNYYEKCGVMCGPRPPAAKEDPLFAANADGFHSGEVRKGPTLVDCYFERLDDDAIAIHGTYAMVLEAHKNKVVALRVAFARNKLIGDVGDALRFYDKNIVFAGVARITGVKGLPDYKPTFEPDASYAVFRSKTKVGYVELTLDREAPAQPSWLIANENQNAAGYVIRDCVMRDIYARGILAKGSGGLIEGCTIERTARAAIEFNTETGLWSESDYARDVVVRNNVIRNASSNRVVGLLRHPGALAILAFRSKDNPYGNGTGNYIPNPGGHRNITIENNRFEDNDGVNLLVSSAQGGDDPQQSIHQSDEKSGRLRHRQGSGP